MKKLGLAIVICLIVSVGGYFVFQNGKSSNTDMTQEQASSSAQNKVNQTNTPTDSVDIINYKDEGENVSAIEHALSERYIGSLDAPVVFYDFSSLSCPHCAKFHNDILPQIKKNFIETGKVRMVFKPMPLNPPALMGVQLARCLPKKDFYKTISLLYANQKIWAFTQNPRASLTNLVKLAGIPKEQTDKCLDNKELESAIIESVQQNAKKYNIQATPTFVFENGARTEKGVSSYEYYAQILNELIEKTKSK